MSFSPHQRPLDLAIFRLEDVCVHIQDGMERFLRTAALQKSAQIEATFRWLSKRRIKIALISDHNQSDTEVLLERLGWPVGEEETIKVVLTDQLSNIDPVRTILDLMRLPDGSSVFSVLDTPRLLSIADANRLKLNLGVTNGRCSYGELSDAPHHALLDEPIQLTNFLLRHLYPVPEERLTNYISSLPSFFVPLRSFFYSVCWHYLVFFHFLW